tara:strand:+ start:5692 stop:7068 length:1377 start_codon:yes stop_codon:yes gene_type:complete
LLFNSQIFLAVFLPICLAGYYLLARSLVVRQWWLIAASCFFYAFWEPRLLPLLVVSIVVNWFFAIAAARWFARWLLVGGVALNLAVLAFFKYADFFAGSLAALLSISHDSFNIILPLGISFFTFQQISYLIDLRRGQASPYGFTDYALYVSFFPQLIAGPIVRHHEIIGQYTLSPMRAGLNRRLAYGLVLLSIGLAKKLLFADEAAEIADPIFAAAAGATVASTSAWAGVLAFTVQIYYDFSGYSDMAIGLALMFGLTLPVNFNAPYTATSVRDFWRRWHITLSTFLRDYLYVPLGGSRHGQARLIAALLVTMLLGGLWHGAAWTFVAWGAVHGLALVVAHGWRGLGWTMPSVVGWALTMLTVMAAWVLFRAPDFATATSMYQSMWPFGDAATVNELDSFVVLYTGAAIAVFGPTSQRFVHEMLKPARWQGAIAGLVLALLVIAAGGIGSEEFIYFQF